MLLPIRPEDFFEGLFPNLMAGKVRDPDGAVRKEEIEEFVETAGFLVDQVRLNSKYWDREGAWDHAIVALPRRIGKSRYLSQWARSGYKNPLYVTSNQHQADSVLAASRTGILDLAQHFEIRTQHQVKGRGFSWDSYDLVVIDECLNLDPDDVFYRSQRVIWFLTDMSRGELEMRSEVNKFFRKEIVTSKGVLCLELGDAHFSTKRSLSDVNRTSGLA